MTPKQVATALSGKRVRICVGQGRWIRFIIVNAVADSTVGKMSALVEAVSSGAPYRRRKSRAR
jgi:hypothetical protein